MGAAPDGPTPRPGNRPTLVGREREQAVLRDALAAALAGRGSLVLIGGEAGIGKTALAEWLLAEAAGQGALVLVGRCYDLSETPPYGPWLEITARYPAGPDLPPRLAVATDRAALRAVASQVALFDAVLAWFAAVAATRPLVLLLDDVHWADPASLDLLRVLARGLGELPLLLLATYRADELTRRHPLYALLPTLEREAQAARLDLRPLGEAALRSLVVPLALPAADAARLVAWLAARAEGNAFFTAQLLRALADEGALAARGDGWALGDLGAVGLPAPLHQVLDARLARLGEDARALLTLAAVIGQAVPLALWAAVAETDEDRLLDAIDAAGDAHLVAVAPDGRAVRFAHALIREALYEGLVATRRRRVHRRVAEALLAPPARAGAPPDPDTVAYHLQRAGDPRAVEWLVRAGDRAGRTYAWLTAQARFEAALALGEASGPPGSERGWLLLRLAAIQRSTDPPRALAYLAAGDANAADGGDPLLAAYALLLGGLVHCYAGATTRGLADLAAGVARREGLAAGGRAPLARVPLAVRQALDDDGVGPLVLRQALAGRVGAARALAERVLAATPGRTAGRPDDPPRGDTYFGLGLAHALLGQPAAARAALEAAAAEHHLAGHHLLVVAAHAARLRAVYQPYYAEDLVAREEVAASLRAALARTSDALLGTTSPDSMLGYELLPAGRWAALRQAGATPILWGNVGEQLILSPWVQLLALTGDAAGARDALRRFFAQGPATAPGERMFHTAVELQRVAAGLALGAGDLPDARAWLDAHDRWLAWGGAVLGRSEGEALWARYHHQAGDPRLARQHAARALAQAADPRQPPALLAARRLLGELDTAAGRYAEAAAHLDTALALADACAVPYERALTVLARAERHVAEGRPDEAAAPLAEARTTFADLGAVPALARADALAARRAAPAPATTPPRAAGAFGLTAREGEVLRLVAQGLGNLAIADRLSLSRRTVEQHLRSVYDKLGVENRAAATRLAVERGLA